MSKDNDARLSRRGLLGGLGAGAALLVPLTGARAADCPAGGGGLFLDLPRRSIPPAQALFRSEGFARPGIGAARYRRADAGETLPDWGHGLWWTLDAAGARWTLAEDEPDSDMFGCARDATRRPDGSVAGSDDTARLNALLRWAEEHGKGKAVIAVGNYRITDTIRIGQGRTFASLAVSGGRISPWPTMDDSQQAFPSAQLLAERNDRPAIAVQGARSGWVGNIVVTGPLDRHITALGLGRSDMAATKVDDWPLAAWQPRDPRHSFGRHNPGCGFAIDPFSGSAPADAYPGARYGQPFSSRVTFERCHAQGFTTGWAVQPCDADGNGDFTEILSCSFSHCIWGVSIGNAQSRNVAISNLKGAFFHTAFTNRHHGRGIGRFGGPILNPSLGQCLQLFDLYTERAAGLTIIGGYAEGLWRLGTAVGPGTIDVQGDWVLAGNVPPGTPVPEWMFPRRGLPVTHFSGDDDGDTLSRLVLKGTVQVATALVVASPLFGFTGQIVSTRTAHQIAREGNAIRPAWRAAAHDASAGGILVQRDAAGNSDIRIASSFPLARLDDGAIALQAQWDGENWGMASREYGTPAWARSRSAPGNPARTAMPPQPRALDAGGWAELAVTGRTVSGRLSPAMLARAIGLAAGALLHHRPSGSWAACSAFDPASGRFAAEIDNGFLIRPDGSVGWPRGAPSWRGGEIAVWS